MIFINNVCVEGLSTPQIVQVITNHRIFIFACEIFSDKFCIVFVVFCFIQEYQKTHKTIGKKPKGKLTKCQINVMKNCFNLQFIFLCGSNCLFNCPFAVFKWCFWLFLLFFNVFYYFYLVFCQHLLWKFDFVALTNAVF